MVWRADDSTGLGSHPGDIQRADFGTQVESTCDNKCVQQVMLEWVRNANRTDNTRVQLASAETKTRPDIQWGQFDDKVPLSHVSPIDTTHGVYRSGRPNGDAGVAAEVTSLWGSYSDANARKTTIIELRGEDKPPFHDQNEQEKKAERDASAARNITHIDFPMQSQEFQKPQYIQSILDTIDRQTRHGQRVVIHCFHGTDRTGLVSAAYQLSHQSPNDIRYRPNHALEMGLERMKEEGFNPANYPQLVRSLDQYIGWKHQQMIKAEHKTGT